MSLFLAISLYLKASRTVKEAWRTDIMSKRRYVLAAVLAALTLLTPFLTASAQPPQYIGAGPVQIPTSAEEFEAMFPGMWGKVIAVIVFVGTFMIVRRFFESDRRRERSSGILGWGIPFIAALLAMVIIGPPLVGMFGVSNTGVSGPSTSCSLTGPIEVRVLDKVTGAAVTGGKVYLLDKTMTLEEVIDRDAKGTLDAPVRAVSSGTVRFDNVQPGDYLLAYLPSSYAANSYEPKLVRISISCAFKPNSDLLVTSINAIELYKMIGVTFVNEVGTSVESYTWKPSSYPAELQGFTVWLKPSAVDGATPYMYLYVNYDDTKVAPTFKIAGTQVAPTKLSDLDGSNPLRLNAPSGYNYVLKLKIDSLYGQDTKKAIEISGNFQGDTTISLAVRYLADSERGDFSGPTFTFTANSAVSSTGWGS